MSSIFAVLTSWLALLPIALLLVLCVDELRRGEGRENSNERFIRGGPVNNGANSNTESDDEAAGQCEKGGSKPDENQNLTKLVEDEKMDVPQDPQQHPQKVLDLGVEELARDERHENNNGSFSRLDSNNGENSNTGSNDLATDQCEEETAESPTKSVDDSAGQNPTNLVDYVPPSPDHEKIDTLEDLDQADLYEFSDNLSKQHPEEGSDFSGEPGQHGTGSSFPRGQLRAEELRRGERHENNNAGRNELATDQCEEGGSKPDENQNLTELVKDDEEIDIPQDLDQLHLHEFNLSKPHPQVIGEPGKHGMDSSFPLGQQPVLCVDKLCRGKRHENKNKRFIGLDSNAGRNELVKLVKHDEKIDSNPQALDQPDLHQSDNSSKQHPQVIGEPGKDGIRSSFVDSSILNSSGSLVDSTEQGSILNHLRYITDLRHPPTNTHNAA